ncbi:hypothetical protein HP499_15750 [Paenarthrobacter sp. CM16]|uniref:hypothetical protein n=1 Tax=Paenarthrobacter sp. CM16 TaxID=2738447 RepID=UPI0015534195|nr:hypothetical protein [Paenarthrobacter sp. CM16]NQD89240.1 hypothetical protein [Paenarthrobacter sp. CM16]
MSNYLQSLRTELRYQLWSKAVVLPIGGLAASLAFSFAGSISNVTATSSRLQTSEAHAAENGVSLGAAMEQPNNVLIQGAQRIVDNPLRFDYEAAYFADRAFEGSHAIGTGLEMITFLVIPLLFFIYGCGTAVGDVRRRTLKDRIVAQGAAAYVAGKVVTIILVSVAAVVLSAMLSLGAAPILRAVFLQSNSHDFIYSVNDAGAGNPIIQIAFATAVAVGFGWLGLFTGLVVRSMLIPCLAAGALLLLLPFAGPYDPRNILTAAAEGVFNYWGGFNPRAPFPVWTELGVLLSVAALVLVALVSTGVWSRMSKFV